VVEKFDVGSGYTDQAAYGTTDLFRAHHDGGKEPKRTATSQGEALRESADVVPAEGKYPDPLAIEFSASPPVARVMGSPEQVTLGMPKTGARPVVVLGASRVLVMDTVDALAGRNEASSWLPDGDRWAYMVHVDGADPKWLLIGVSEWSADTDLSDEIERENAPVFLVILDGKSPKLSEARRVIEAVPQGRGTVVVVLVSIDREERSRVQKLLSPSMRRLFRVPERVPVVVADRVETIECRRWLRLALSQY
jgi:hypothetical protein